MHTQNTHRLVKLFIKRGDSTISAQTTKIKLNIGGMTCVHCQEKIQSALSETEGIISAEVSYGTGTAEIEYDALVLGIDDIKRIIENLDYKVLTEGQNVSRLKLFYPFILLGIIVAVFVPLQVFGILNYLAPTELADSSMGFGMLFVIGLITSVHCIAMCGGINLSQCIPKSENEVQKGFKTFIPALFYNLGRVISYTLIGLILGFIGWIVGSGTSVGISSIIQGVFKIIAGLLMILMGVNMLNLIPVLRKMNPTMPKFLARKIGKTKASATKPFIVGILNGIMPCGPLQSMWIVALATGNPFSGALSMFLFALGTVPLMLGLGSIVAKLGQKFTKTIMTVGSLLVVVLGLAMLSQGGSLTGFISPVVISAAILGLIAIGVILSVPSKGKWSAMKSVAAGVVAVAIVAGVYLYSASPVMGDYDEAVMGDGVQTVQSELKSGSYPDIAVKSGVPVIWIINAPSGSINGCNNRILIPEYGIEYTFQYGENIIEFTPTKSGTFDYSCWMGMIYGKIIVTG